MDLQSFDSEGFSYVLFLFVKITLPLFPSLNFIEDGTDVITRLANSLLSINESFQVIDDFDMSELVSLVDEIQEFLLDSVHHVGILLWTR